VLERDLEWLARLDGEHDRRILDEWDTRLADVDGTAVDQRERELLSDLRRRVREERSR
jgi:hypothetical protein